MGVRVTGGVASLESSCGAAPLPQRHSQTLTPLRRVWPAHTVSGGRPFPPPAGGSLDQLTHPPPPKPSSHCPPPPLTRPSPPSPLTHPTANRRAVAGPPSPAAAHPPRRGDGRVVAVRRLCRAAAGLPTTGWGVPCWQSAGGRSVDGLPRRVRCCRPTVLGASSVFHSVGTGYTHCPPARRCGEAARRGARRRRVPATTPSGSSAPPSDTDAGSPVATRADTPAASPGGHALALLTSPTPPPTPGANAHDARPVPTPRTAGHPSLPLVLIS